MCKWLKYGAIVVAGMLLLSSSPHEQVRTILPSSLHVGNLTVTYADQLCEHAAEANTVRAAMQRTTATKIVVNFLIFLLLFLYWKFFGYIIPYNTTQVNAFSKIFYFIFVLLKNYFLHLQFFRLPRLKYNKKRVKYTFSSIIIYFFFISQKPLQSGVFLV